LRSGLAEFPRVHSRFSFSSAYIRVYLRLRFVVAVQVNIRVFGSLLTAGYDREELDPKFFFVELNKSIHNQFPGRGDGCLKWLAPRSWKASEIGCKEDDKPTMTESKYQS
jgi:hypothetical protein